MISNTVRAIRAIRLKQYNHQYGQNNQSNIISNIIRTIPKVVTVTLSVIFMHKPET